MKSLKSYVILFVVLFTIILVLPAVLVIPFKSEQANSPSTQQVVNSALPAEENVVEVAVYRSEEQKIEHVPFEEYVAGVVASEMPAEFELEALKAQALTARTYIVKQMMNEETIGLPEGAMVTDTVMHQVYKDPEELKQIWGKEFQWKMGRIYEAVEATQGQVITYNGQPITASFFSTSNGYTENSEDYWQNPFPYLKSVESPWDRQSPKFSAVKVFSLQDFENLLGVKVGANATVGTVIEETAGKRIAKIKISDKVFTGRDIRTKLGLNSADFSLTRDGNKVVAQTRGWGHGVGMSQYGANGMASEGKVATDIIAHYYQGTTISSMTPFTAKWTAKK